ncbi:MAG TPA: glycosyltransferase family 2 protein, partial [Tabrizicola sp.]|nr:glycosyltransferase family 2 protein [Tabrizicola sp.]
MSALVDRTAQIGADDILCFVCVRNEAARLPHFLRHHRALGVRHFLIVDNASSDGSATLL